MYTNVNNNPRHLPISDKDFWELTNTERQCRMYNLAQIYWRHELAPLAKDATPKKNKEKENNMGYTSNAAISNAEVTVVDPNKAKVKHLTERLRDIRDEWVCQKLQKMFNIGVSNSPKDFKSLIEKIQKGEYTIDEDVASELEKFKKKNITWYFDSLYGIQWDGVKPDTKGYAAARDELNKAYQAAKDEIIVLDPIDGLKALNAFQNWKPSNAPVANDNVK